MQFDIITYPNDGWAKGEHVIATVEAETALEAVKAWAKSKNYQLDLNFGNSDPNRAIAGVYDDKMPAKDIMQDMTPYRKGTTYDLWHKAKVGYRVPGTRRKARWVPGPARVTVTAYPYMQDELRAYNGEVIQHENQKQAITAAFKDLRREGFTARQNYMCCNSCAGANMPDGKPAVYYSRQNDDAWFNGRYPRKGTRCSDLQSKLYLHYGIEDGDDRDCGIQVLRALQRHGLPVEWDGDPTNCIVVLPEDSSSDVH